MWSNGQKGVVDEMEKKKRELEGRKRGWSRRNIRKKGRRNV